jgi:hypothetical protein
VSRDDQDLARSSAACRGRHRFLDLADVVGGVDRRVQLARGDEAGDLADDRTALLLRRVPIAGSGGNWPYSPVSVSTSEGLMGAATTSTSA